ncbi:Transposase [Azospirillum argentinense]|uniref:Mutator family transposase n=1 Tax=Azospirillum argentinense TaxID=2970906 RepID=A0A5B0KQM6_9PROT|nr:Transposase [Azospirillum argentinense]
MADGAPGFWKALEEVFPTTRHQRCWQHKTVNVLNKVAKAVNRHGVLTAIGTETR